MSPCNTVNNAKPSEPCGKDHIGVVMREGHLKYNWQRDFFDYICQQGLSKVWRWECRRTLIKLDLFLEKQQITDLNKIKKQDLISFQGYLYEQWHYSEHTVKSKVFVLKSLFRYLYYKNLIITNPAHDLKLEKRNTLHAKSKRYYSWKEFKRRWVNNMRSCGYTWAGIRQKLTNLNQFIDYLNGQEVKSAYKVKAEHVLAYQDYLRKVKLPNGESYQEFCIFLKLYHLDQFFRYLKFYFERFSEIPTERIDFTKYRSLVRAKKENNKAERRLLPLSCGKKIEDLMRKYLSWRSLNGRRDNQHVYLRKFSRFLETRGISGLSDIKKQDILEYKHYLSNSKTRFGKPFSLVTIRNYLCPIFILFRFLIDHEYLAIKNPVSLLEYPRGGGGLPRTLMTVNEVAKLLNAPDIFTPVGLRDRTIMEVFYSTGIRVNELANLAPADINYENGTVQINHPKGGEQYQRVTPIGVIACDWVKKYLNSARHLFNIKNESYLFLTSHGNKITSTLFSMILRGYCFKLGIKKQITCHSFRVTCATLMLKNKADIRHVQEQLGHRKITSTQIYTRLIPYDLKKMHHKCHPREREARGLKALDLL